MEKEHWKGYLWFRTILGLSILIVLLLFAGGRINYWQAWLYILINVVFIGLTNWHLRDNPSLLLERIFPGHGVKNWDRVYWAVSTPVYFVLLIVAGMDAGRNRWSHSLPSLSCFGRKGPTISFRASFASSLTAARPSAAPGPISMSGTRAISEDWRSG